MKQHFFSLQLPLLLLLLLMLQLLLTVTHHTTNAQIYAAPSRENRNYWTNLAISDLKKAKSVYQQIRYNRAKNVLFFLGDGMGLPSITAGRILKGQLKNQSGEEALLSFEQMPHTALIKTYNTDMQTPDSAGTATAFLCGVKAKSGTVGVDQHIQSKNCSTYSEVNKVYSFLEEAADAGKSVGIVTTTRITHATPSAAYAHTVWRDWEDDSERDAEVPEGIRDRCPDIAQQLISKSTKFSVVFGGGRLKFLPKNITTYDRVSKTMKNGLRSDGRHLINEWKRINAGRRAMYIETRDELMNLSVAKPGTVLGLFATSHLRYDIDNQNDDSYKEPTLTEMTRKALEILQRNPKGFALLVEGGRIDHGHHDAKAKKAIYEMVAFDAAIDAGVKSVNSQETLTIVTADHSHTFNIGGYADRGNSLFGKIRYSFTKRWNSKGEALADDNKPFTSINYADGPSAPIRRQRQNITNVNTHDVEFMPGAAVPRKWESHGDEDVAVYATGPAAHLLHSTHEQSYIGNLVKHALCVGHFLRNNYCLADVDGDVNGAANVIGMIRFEALLMIVMVLQTGIIRSLVV